MTPSDFHTELAALLPRLRRFATAAVRRGGDADALLRAVLERVLAHPHEWHAGSRLDLWMFGLLARAVRDSGHTPPAADGGDTQQHSLRIEHAVASLPERQRLAVALVLVDGLHYRDAAAVLGVTIAELTAQLAQARLALHELLSDHARKMP